MPSCMIHLCQQKVFMEMHFLPLRRKTLKVFKQHYRERSESDKLRIFLNVNKAL